MMVQQLVTFAISVLPFLGAGYLTELLLIQPKKRLCYPQFPDLDSYSPPLLPPFTSDPTTPPNWVTPIRFIALICYTKQLIFFSPLSSPFLVICSPPFLVIRAGIQFIVLVCSMEMLLVPVTWWELKLPVCS